MIDEDSDWMSFHEAVTYVEVTLHCYRGMARQLLRKAVNNMKVKLERLLRRRCGSCRLLLDRK